jgi:predicted lysophospholipase L1 biosynthesis ABC-type transport system permease subunit
MSLLGSWLYYGPTWSIPADALAAVPEDVRPAELFSPVEAGQAADRAWDSDSYIVEFADKNEARAALQRNDPASATMVTPYGSGTLVVDQFRQWFLVALLWALAIVGGVAMIIMAGLIGRMVSDGRRESAVFRAIGARRVDIASIYGVYALLLSVRVALFALLGGLALALGIELWLSSDATLSARLAYAAIDTNKEFHFIGIGSWYVPAMLGVIVLTGLIASIAPILLGVRRNPINDMRDDT